MAAAGYIYVPPSCRRADRTCRVHVALHGCKQDAKEFASSAGYNNWAEQYGVIVVYPAVEPDVVPVDEVCSKSSPDFLLDYWPSRAKPQRLLGLVGLSGHSKPEEPLPHQGRPADASDRTHHRGGYRGGAGSAIAGIIARQELEATGTPASQRSHHPDQARRRRRVDSIAKPNASSEPVTGMPQANLIALLLGLGGAVADAWNRLSVNTPAVLLNNAGADRSDGQQGRSRQRRSLRLQDRLQRPGADRAARLGRLQLQGQPGRLGLPRRYPDRPELAAGSS